MGDRFRSEVVANETVPFSLDCYYLGGGDCSNPPRNLTGWSNPIIGASSGSCVQLYEYREMQDVVTPRFKEFSAKGRIINNPMTKSSIIRTEDPIHFDICYMVQRYGCSPTRLYDQNEHHCVGTQGVMQHATLLPLSFDPDLIDQAVSLAHARIGHDDMLAITTLAEADKTIDGLIFLLRKVFRMLKYLRKANVRKLRGELSLKELEEVYMNVRYNLRPLYYDTQAAIRVINEPKFAKRRQTFRAQKTASDEATDTSSRVIYNHDPYYVVTADILRKTKIEVKVRAGVLTSLDEAGLCRRLGVDKIPETMWELIPFSFIVDWFCNIGDVISSWSPKFGVEKLTSWYTVEKITTSDIQVSNFSLSVESGSYGNYISPITFQMTDGSYHQTLIEKERVPDPSRSLIPSLDINLNPAKLIDLGIIAKNMRSRRTQWFSD